MSANLQACAFLLGRLQSEVIRLRAIAFPGHDTGPRKWLNFVSGLLDTASAYLNSARSGKVSAVDAARLIKEAEHIGDNAYQLLTFVAGADSTQIPHQVVAPFQRWVEGLGIKQTIFFRAEHLPNYEISWIDLRTAALINGASKSLLDATAAIEWPVLRVSVPGHAMGLLPHFAVVGHELGHAIQDRIKPDLSAHTQSLDDFLTRTRSRLAHVSIAFDKKDEIEASKTLVSWVNELKADAVGHYLVGPAFFFALCGFLELSGQGYGIGPTHPPSDLRRSLLFQKLSEGTLSFAGVFETATSLPLTEELNSPHISRRLSPEEMFKELAQVVGPVLAAICVELVPAIELIAPEVFRAALSELQATCPAFIYSPEQLQADLSRHLEYLCNLIPPVEFQREPHLQPCTLTTILNVGWSALLSRVERFPAARGISPTDPTAARMECLHELLLKAVELSEARQLWEELG